MLDIGLESLLPEPSCAKYWRAQSPRGQNISEAQKAEYWRAQCAKYWRAQCAKYWKLDYLKSLSAQLAYSIYV